MAGETCEAHELNPPTRNLVEMLRQLGATGISQSLIARRANVPPQYLSDVRHGRRPLTELFARRLEEEFGYNFLWLLGLEDSPKRAVSSVPPSPGEKILLPKIGEAIAGDPREHPSWRGDCLEVAGIVAAKAARAILPYVLELGHSDREGRLRKGDLVLVSQGTAEKPELSVVRCEKKILLARKKGPNWRGAETGEPLRGKCELTGHCVGVIWSALI